MPGFDNKRRLMLGTMLMGAGAVFAVYKYRGDKVESFYAKDTQVLLHLAYHLFPQSKLGPGSADLHISGYLASVLQDRRIMQDDRTRFLKGGHWLEESAFESYSKSFLSLDNDQKESLLQEISQQRWGRNLIHTSLGYIFEALLSAPVYGSNIDGIGWTWLEHDPGFPLPEIKEEINYEI